MIRPGLRAQPQVSAGKRGAEFRYQFFRSIGAITETLTQLSVTSASAGRPMRMLVRQCRVVGNIFIERLKRRHLDMVGTGRIVRLVATVPDVGPNNCKERFGMRYAVIQGGYRLSE